jgi:MFS transporter, DHA1 family, inner membrane transport protein
MDDSSARDTALRHMPWILLTAACWGTFVVTGSGMIRSPFLLEMSRDLDASLSAVANLFSLTAFAWGIASLLAGAASDRLGRRPLLMIAHALMIAGIVGIAFSRSYAMVAVWTLLAGFGGGGHMGVIFAAVSDRVGEAQRGRAMGWIITGQSLALVVGVPLATWIGTFTDWRGVMLCVAAADLVAVLGLRLTLPASTRRPGGGGGVSFRTALPDRRLTALLAAGVTERVCFGVVGVYFATMLQLRYGLNLGQLTVPLAVMAVGNLLGNAVGGRIADRFVREHCFAAASVATAVLALALFAWDPGLVACVAIAFAYTFVNAVGRPAVVAVLSQVPSEIRGALMGLNITCASVGWITAAAIGGVLIDVHGIGSLAILTFAMGMLGAALALWARRLALVARPA